MPYNRFTKSQKIGETEFVGIVFDFALGMTPAACAERIGISEKTIRKYFKKIQETLYTSFIEHADSKFNSIFLTLTDADWEKVYFCMFECPNNVNEDYSFVEFDINPLLSTKLRSKRFRVPKGKRLGACTKCELLHPFDIDEELAFHIAFRMNTARGSNKSKFGDVFLNEFLRHSSLTLTPDTDRNAILVVRSILIQCQKKPL
ncbi:MAG: helix-turn-helix transcriptional regulator [Alphaproteobacteria bacterium]